MSGLPALSSFTFGCMSLGSSHDLAEIKSHIAVARSAMDADVWFHASQEYAGGGAFMIMRHAFDEDRARTPKLILKIRCDNANLLKFDVEDALRRLNVDCVDLAQLCRARHDDRPVVDDFIHHGDMWRICKELQTSGKVGQFIMEIFESYSTDAKRAANADLFPAYIFYFSPAERQTSSELFNLLQRENKPILSLRTLGGGSLDPTRIQSLRANAPGDRAITKFDALRPIFERSGAASWLEFSMSFLKSFPNLRTTIAGTSNQLHLRQLLEADKMAQPMEAPLASEIVVLQSEWSKIP